MRAIEIVDVIWSPVEYFRRHRDGAAPIALALFVIVAVFAGQFAQMLLLQGSILRVVSFRLGLIGQLHVAEAVANSQHLRMALLLLSSSSIFFFWITGVLYASGWAAIFGASELSMQRVSALFGCAFIPLLVPAVAGAVILCFYMPVGDLTVFAGVKSQAGAVDAMKEYAMSVQSLPILAALRQLQTFCVLWVVGLWVTILRTVLGLSIARASFIMGSWVGMLLLVNSLSGVVWP